MTTTDDCQFYSVLIYVDATCFTPVWSQATKRRSRSNDAVASSVSSVVMTPSDAVFADVTL